MNASQNPQPLQARSDNRVHPVLGAEAMGAGALPHPQHIENNRSPNKANSLASVPRSQALIALGESIRERRVQKGLTQMHFAEECGLHRTYVCDVERGERNVTFLSLLKFARALEISASDLIHDAEMTVDAEKRTP
jgi:ribosome-binding protein aMBF1 (putative translation factor)